MNWHLYIAIIGVNVVLPSMVTIDSINGLFWSRSFHGSVCTASALSALQANKTTNYVHQYSYIKSCIEWSWGYWWKKHVNMYYIWLLSWQYDCIWPVVVSIDQWSVWLVAYAILIMIVLVSIDLVAADQITLVVSGDFKCSAHGSHVMLSTFEPSLDGQVNASTADWLLVTCHRVRMWACGLILHLHKSNHQIYSVLFASLIYHLNWSKVSRYKPWINELNQSFDIDVHTSGMRVVWSWL